MTIRQAMMQNRQQKNRFTQLMSALDDGWEIDEPILLGAMWGKGPQKEAAIYHFVLRKQRDDQTILMSLPLSPSLLVFLSENNLTVNAR